MTEYQFWSWVFNSDAKVKFALAVITACVSAGLILSALHLVLTLFFPQVFRKKEKS
jgi:hypothetical protein